MMNQGNLYVKLLQSIEPESMNGGVVLLNKHHWQLKYTAYTCGPKTI